MLDRTYQDAVPSAIATLYADIMEKEAEIAKLRDALQLVAWSGKFSCFDDAAWDIITAAAGPDAKATGSVLDAGNAA